MHKTLTFFVCVVLFVAKLPKESKWVGQGKQKQKQQHKQKQ